MGDAGAAIRTPEMLLSELTLTEKISLLSGSYRPYLREDPWTRLTY